MNEYQNTLNNYHDNINLNIEVEEYADLNLCNEKYCGVNCSNNKSKKHICKDFKHFLIMGIFFTLSLMFFGCNNNTDTYKNADYFKENYSQVVPQIINTNEEEHTVVLAEAVAPAIVAISASNGNVVNIGSGVSVKSGGYIITNHHVIENSKNIQLFFHDNTTAKATVLWQDKIMDIALLKSSKAIPYLEMGDNSYTKAGQNVVAVGTPLSLNFTHSFTKGIVSAINRTIKINTDYGEALMQNLIQHDASINPGNSGGPILNSIGQVIGINTLKISAGEGMGFAVPISAVSSIVENVYKNYNYTTPYLGVYSHDASLEDIYNDANTSEAGVIVVDVANNSPAGVAGIKNGDIIVGINGVEITNALDMRKQLYKYNAFDKLTITVKRKNKIYVFKVVLGGNPNVENNVE